MGKKSGITKGGRTMNPADRERKQLRAKELKRNKKQRTAVRHAIVKGRDPDEIIEAMSRLDEQEFDPQRQLSLNVIQEKRSKLRGSFYQIVGLYRQEKEEKKVKNLERMLLEYETERARKEENFRAQMFSQNADFEDIPLPMGTSVPGSASTPSFSSINIGGQIGPQILPQQLQSTMKASILKKSTSSTTKKKHKYPPGPPPGLPPQLFDSDEDEEEDEGRDERRERSKRVRFGEEPTKRRGGGGEEERGEYDYEGEEDEDYAPVEIPEELLDPGNQPHQQQGMGIYSSQQQVPSLAAPIIGSGPIMPTMAPPPPAYPPAGYPIPSGRPMQMPHSERMARGGQMAAAHSSNKNGQSSYPPPDDPHPSAIISAEPQVVKPNVNLPTAGQTVISSGPQMRNIAKESTRFVPAAVKLGRSIVQQPAIGPKIPTPSSSVAGTSTKLVPRSATTAKQQKARMEGNGGKSMDQACDEFLKELEGLF